MPPLLILTYVGFVSLGLPDAVIGVAWPSLRTAFALPQSALGALLVGTGVGYFSSGIAAGRLVERLGVGKLLAVSSGLITVAMFGYASTPVWPLLILCGLIAGLGSGAIDSGLNAYAASNFSARHVNWLHACYCVGAALGPLIATAALATTGSWRWGYAILGAIMLVLTTAFALAKASFRARPAAGAGAQEAPGVQEVPPAQARAALRQPRVWLQIAVFFLYTGLEVTLGQWSFTVNTEARGVATETAGIWAGAYWASIGVGRVLLGLAVDRVGADRLLRMATVAALLGSALFAVGPAWPGAAGLMLAGLGLAPIYPTLMSRTPARLGPYTAHAIGFQVSAGMIGGAILPSIGGFLAARVGLSAIGTLAVAASVGLWLLHEALLRATREPVARHRSR
ncbi:MFS transporter [Sorangium cellulosum]|uniref:MFS transporter n=1 Tax=Sorangium cellulosum TaxID=56 RepID=A0A2L0F4M5_SORCE|nr:MFS transporter [Sorangium cellulosum]AUX46493.1 MFS transporter [Sorangium cellulosum]